MGDNPVCHKIGPFLFRRWRGSITPQRYRVAQLKISKGTFINVGGAEPFVIYLTFPKVITITVNPDRRKYIK